MIVNLIFIASISLATDDTGGTQTKAPAQNTEAKGKPGLYPICDVFPILGQENSSAQRSRGRAYIKKHFPNLAKHPLMSQERLQQNITKRVGWNDNQGKYGKIGGRKLLLGAHRAAIAMGEELPNMKVNQEAEIAKKLNSMSNEELVFKINNILLARNYQKIGKRKSGSFQTTLDYADFKNVETNHRPMVQKAWQSAVEGHDAFKIGCPQLSSKSKCQKARQALAQKMTIGLVTKGTQDIESAIQKDPWLSMVDTQSTKNLKLPIGPNDLPGLKKKILEIARKRLAKSQQEVKKLKKLDPYNEAHKQQLIDSVSLPMFLRAGLHGIAERLNQGEGDMKEGLATLYAACRKAHAMPERRSATDVWGPMWKSAATGGGCYAGAAVATAATGGAAGVPAVAFCAIASAPAGYMFASDAISKNAANFDNTTRAVCNNIVKLAGAASGDLQNDCAKVIKDHDNSITNERYMEIASAAMSAVPGVGAQLAKTSSNLLKGAVKRLSGSASKAAAKEAVKSQAHSRSSKLAKKMSNAVNSAMDADEAIFTATGPNRAEMKKMMSRTQELVTSGGLDANSANRIAKVYGRQYDGKPVNPQFLGGLIEKAASGNAQVRRQARKELHQRMDFLDMINSQKPANGESKLNTLLAKAAKAQNPNLDPNSAKFKAEVQKMSRSISPCLRGKGGRAELKFNTDDTHHVVDINSWNRQCGS